MWTKPPPKKLRVRPYRQTPGLCGPAALKIALSYFGQNYSEQKLAAWSGATAAHGAEHEGLVAAAKKAGAQVVAKEGGTMAELEYYVSRQRWPVIVGWFDRDGDHYSVVIKVSKKRLVLADPQTKLRRYFKKKAFPDIWFDFVGPENKIVSWGWYMAINFPD